MGGFLPDICVGGLLEQLNLRFGPGDAINEMVAMQREFKVFSSKHSLQDSFALLNLGPDKNWAHRRKWFEYLTTLNECDSDKRGQSGHDRLVSALEEHLSKSKAGPIHFTSHESTKKSKLTVSAKPKLPLVYSKIEFTVVSLPMTAVEKDRKKRRAK